MARATDRQVAGDLVRVMRADPWRTWTKTELAERVGRTPGRVVRILDSSSVFISQMADGPPVYPIRHVYQLSGRLFV